MVMIEELYDALREAGASEEKVRAAARAMAGYEDRFAGLERKLTAVDGRVSLLQWMVGFNLALTVAVVFRVFSH